MSKSFKYLPKSFPQFKAQKPGRLSKAVYSSLNVNRSRPFVKSQRIATTVFKKKLFRYNRYILCSAINNSDQIPFLQIFHYFGTFFRSIFFYLNNWDTIEGIERQRSVTQTQAMYEKRRVERIFANDSLRTIFSTLKLPEIFFYCSTFISGIIQ